MSMSAPRATAHTHNLAAKSQRPGAVAPRPSRRERPRLRVSPLAAYLLTFSLAYIAALVVPYAFADDYSYLGDKFLGTLWEKDLIHQIQWGRPTMEFLLQVAFGLMRDIGDLRYLRLVGVIGVALLAWMLYRALLAAGLTRVRALLAPFFICAMPPFQVYVGFAVTAVTVFATLLGGAALLMADRALDTWQAAAPLRRQPLLLGLGAIALFTLGLSLYPPAAMVFWVFAAIQLFVVDRSLSATARRFAAYLAFAAVPFACEFLLTRLLPLLLPANLPGSYRTQIVQDVGAKAVWFARGPLLDALNLGNLAVNVTVAAVVAAMVLVGLLLYFGGELPARLGKLAIALALVPLTYAPNLLAAQNLPSYRTQAGLDALLALYACLALFGYARAWKAQESAFGRRATTAALFGMALASVVLAGVNVTWEFVIPQEVEYQYVAQQLRAASQSNTDSVYFILACWCDNTAPVVRYDEFGLPSTSRYWVPIPMTYLVLRDIAPAKAHLRVIVADRAHPLSAYRGSYIINMHALKHLR
jgi:hypothetical protein